MISNVNPRLHTYWPLIMVMGVLNVLLGFEIFTPMFKGEAIPTLVGLVILAGAVFAIINTFVIGGMQERRYGIPSIVIRLVAAYLLLFDASDRHFTFTILLATYFGLDGALLCAESARLKRFRVSYMPYLIIGVTSVLFSLALWTFEGGAMFSTVADFLSITFWIRGAVLIITALKLRKQVPVVSQPVATFESES